MKVVKKLLIGLVAFLVSGCYTQLQLSNKSSKQTSKKQAYQSVDPYFYSYNSFYDYFYGNRWGYPGYRYFGSLNFSGFPYYTNYSNYFYQNFYGGDSYLAIVGNTGNLATNYGPRSIGTDRVIGDEQRTRNRGQRSAARSSDDTNRTRSSEDQTNKDGDRNRDIRSRSDSDGQRNRDHARETDIRHTLMPLQLSDEIDRVKVDSDLQEVRLPKYQVRKHFRGVVGHRIAGYLQDNRPEFYNQLESFYERNTSQSRIRHRAVSVHSKYSDVGLSTRNNSSDSSVERTRSSSNSSGSGDVTRSRSRSDSSSSRNRSGGSSGGGSERSRGN